MGSRFVERAVLIGVDSIGMELVEEIVRRIESRSRLQGLQNIDPFYEAFPAPCDPTQLEEKLLLTLRVRDPRLEQELIERGVSMSSYSSFYLCAALGDADIATALIALIEQITTFMATRRIPHKIQAVLILPGMLELQAQDKQASSAQTYRSLQLVGETMRRLDHGPAWVVDALDNRPSPRYLGSFSQLKGDIAEFVVLRVLQGLFVPDEYSSRRTEHPLAAFGMAELVFPREGLIRCLRDRWIVQWLTPFISPLRIERNTMVLQVKQFVGQDLQINTLVEALAQDEHRVRIERDFIPQTDETLPTGRFLKELAAEVERYEGELDEVKRHFHQRSAALLQDHLQKVQARVTSFIPEEDRKAEITATGISHALAFVAELLGEGKTSSLMHGEPLDREVNLSTIQDGLQQVIQESVPGADPTENPEECYQAEGKKLLEGQEAIVKSYQSDLQRAEDDLSLLQARARYLLAKFALWIPGAVLVALSLATAILSQIEGIGLWGVLRLSGIAIPLLGAAALVYTVWAAMAYWRDVGQELDQKHKEIRHIVAQLKQAKYKLKCHYQDYFRGLLALRRHLLALQILKRLTKEVQQIRDNLQGFLEHSQRWREDHVCFNNDVFQDVSRRMQTSVILPQEIDFFFARFLGGDEAERELKRSIQPVSILRRNLLVQSSFERFAEEIARQLDDYLRHKLQGLSVEMVLFDDAYQPLQQAIPPERRLQELLTVVPFVQISDAGEVQLLHLMGVEDETKTLLKRYTQESTIYYSHGDGTRVVALSLAENVSPTMLRPYGAHYGARAEPKQPVDAASNIKRQGG
jgi:hypothetical protein